MDLIAYPVFSILHKRGPDFGSTDLPEAYREDRSLRCLRE